MEIITEYELNRKYAQELTKLMLDNPDMRVVVWVYSEGITDDYICWAGHLDKPRKETIAFSEAREHYVSRDGDDYEDCSSYYGDVADDWDDETMAKKAAEIPWEDVIAVNASIT